MSRLRSLVAALVCLTASCVSYVQPNATQYVGVPRFEPTQRHDRLGEIMLYASGSSYLVV